MGLIRQLAKQVLTACAPRQALLMRGAPHPPGARARLALTFDDGPHPEHTPALLDTLRTCRASGTFFVIGRSAEQYPDLIRRISDEGHEIGNHTWSHGDPERTSSRDFLDEVKRTDELIEALCGRRPTVVRPPKGELNVRKLAGLWKQKKTVTLWNIDPKDYRMRSADEIDAWCGGYRPKDGDILLMHDNHPWANLAIQRLLGPNVCERFDLVHVSTLAVKAGEGRPPDSETAGLTRSNRSRG